MAELSQVFTILSRSSDQLASGIAELVSAYLPGLMLLHDYDEGSVAMRIASCQYALMREVGEHLQTHRLGCGHVRLDQLIGFG